MFVLLATINTFFPIVLGTSAIPSRVSCLRGWFGTVGFLGSPGFCSVLGVMLRTHPMVPPLTCMAPPLTLPAACAVAVVLQLSTIRAPACRARLLFSAPRSEPRGPTPARGVRLVPVRLAAPPASLCSPGLSSDPMAALVLEDGSVLQGRPFGAAVSTAGEVGKQARAGCRPHPTLLNLSTPPAHSSPRFGGHSPGSLSPLTTEAVISSGICCARGSVLKAALARTQSCLFLQCFRPAWSATQRPSLTLRTKLRS